MSFFGIDLVSLIKTIGYLGIFGIIFAESGLFLGFFLPGDSLLFTAGFLASQNFLDIQLLIFLTFSGAVIGDSVGYWFGKKIGPTVFAKENSFLFHKDHIERSRIFFEQHGSKAIVLARFMPIIRTFTPILAGVGGMKYAAFLFFNIAGGAIWAVGIPLLGYYFGSIIPDPDRYIVPVILIIIFLSFLPPLIHFLKDTSYREKLFRAIKNKILR